MPFTICGCVSMPTLSLHIYQLLLLNGKSNAACHSDLILLGSFSDCLDFLITVTFKLPPPLAQYLTLWAVGISGIVASVQMYVECPYFLVC